MNQEKIRPEWNKLESSWMNIFTEKFPGNDLPVIEHKPQNFPLMVLPQEYKEEEIEEVLL